MDLVKLQGLRDYFAGLDPSQIKQAVSPAIVVLAGACGCFGVHSDIFHAKPLCDFNRDLNERNYRDGVIYNYFEIGLGYEDIEAAWKRISDEEIRLSWVYPYGTVTWPFPVVATLDEVLRYERENEDDN